MNLHDTLIRAVTAYDRQNSRRAGYNYHALPLYFQAVDRVEEAVTKGAAVEQAINDNFNGCLADRCLKAAKGQQ